MPNLPDITTPTDVKTIVDCFYAEVKNDKLLSPFFTEVNWATHLPIMYNFWCNVLFYDGSYDGNPMVKHQWINKKSPIGKKHFTHWIKHFNHSVDGLYVGKNASLLKARANAMANIMLKNFQA